MTDPVNTAGLVADTLAAAGWQLMPPRPSGQRWAQRHAGGSIQVEYAETDGDLVTRVLDRADQRRKRRVGGIQQTERARR